MSGVLESSANPLPKYLVSDEEHSHRNTGSDGAPVKIPEDVDVKMSDFELDHDSVGVWDDKTGTATKRDGGQASRLEAVRHL